MMYREFATTDSFTCGAFGQPGQRTFVLQVRADGERITMKCEKQQVAALSQYIRQLLEDAPDVDERPIEDAMQITPPIEMNFIVGTVGIAYDPRNDRMVVQIDELVPGEDEDDSVDDHDGARVRLHITRGQAAAFCEHADDVVAAGRPLCVFCGRPIDLDGHPCPRMN
jgi:uncharacterized repeat protein (TIGR03847 family)